MISTLPTLTASELPTLSAQNACGACRLDGTLFPFTMAFQPIVDVANRSVYAYEALVRGINGEGAGSILSQVTEENRYAFDQGCRVKAIELAAKLGLAQTGARLSVNFMPGAVYSPAACIQKTLQASREHQFPLELLTFELTEDERVRDIPHLKGIVREYRRHGFAIAMDDFGAGYSGLNLMAELQPNIIKFDGAMVRGIDERPWAQEVIRSTVALAHRLGVTVVAECIETATEMQVLEACGVHLMQGYLFARPGFECLPEIAWPGAVAAA